jgi:hypothetical protein
MLATILKGPVATQTTIGIIETFARIREFGRNVKQLSIPKTENEKQSLLDRNGELIAEILVDELGLIGTETTIELIFALVKIQHPIKRDKK